MKVLVTGGAGYIGSILTEALLLNGCSVTVLDKFIYERNSLFYCCSSKNLDIINGDLLDYSHDVKFIETFDVIFPLAANVGAPLCGSRAAESRSINLDANLRLIRSTSQQQRIIMPTTNSAYGKGEQNGYCDENSPLRPISQYAREKVELEEELMSRENSISLRLATVFGMSPRMRFDLLVNDFVLRAFRDKYLVLYEPNFRRNYIHVRDVVSAFIHCLLRFDDFKGNIFNVGLEDANLTKLELAKTVAKYIKNTQISVVDNIKDPDQRDYLVSNRKIMSTGWSPVHSLESGIQEIIRGLSTLRLYEYGNV